MSGCGQVKGEASEGELGSRVDGTAGTGISSTGGSLAESRAMGGAAALLQVLRALALAGEQANGSGGAFIKIHAIGKSGTAQGNSSTGKARSKAMDSGVEQKAGTGAKGTIKMP